MAEIFIQFAFPELEIFRITLKITITEKKNLFSVCKNKILNSAIK